MSKNNDNNTKYIILLSSVTLLLTGSLYVGYKMMKSESDYLSTRRAILNSYELEVNKINKVFEDFHEAEAQQEELNRIIPDRENVAGFVEQLEAIGNILDAEVSITLHEGIIDEKGVVVETTSQAAETLTKHAGITEVEVLEVGVDVKGELHQIVNFIGMVDELKFYTQISSVKLLKTSSEERGEFVEGTFIINLFVKRGAKTK